MLTQAGLSQLTGGLLSPFVVLWLLATAALLWLAVFGFIIALVRMYNQNRDH